MAVIVYNLKRMMNVLGRSQLAAALATAWNCLPTPCFTQKQFRRQNQKSDVPELGTSPVPCRR
jgi:hypothetical protein